MAGIKRIAEPSMRFEPEWQWFVMPSDANGIFRQQGLQFTASNPLWARPAASATDGHLRVTWSGGLVGTLIVEVRWDEAVINAELSKMDASATRDYPRRADPRVDGVIDRCVALMTSDCLGTTIESAAQSPTTDGNRLTMEYRSADAIYAIARRNPLIDSRRRGLVDLVQCTCDLMRLPQGNPPDGVRLMCEDVRKL
jgi:hypothetical protein